MSHSHSNTQRAAGADNVVESLIDEKGIDPGKKPAKEISVLSFARSLKYNENVLPYLIELLKKTKDQRLPPPKKLLALAERDVMNYLPHLSLQPWLKQKLEQIIDAIFVEEHSVSIDEFYEIIQDQDPDMVFPCIELISQTSTTPPKDKSIKKVTGKPMIHHGNLEVTGNLNVISLMVTGNLKVHGEVKNVQGRQLYVGGDLGCDNMYTEGPAIIGGNLKAKKIEAIYNDYALDVKQTLSAHTLIIDKHQVKAGKMEVEERVEL